MSTNISRQFPAFARKFFDSTEDFTIIGTGELGGKATGLAFMHDLLAHTPDLAHAQMTVSIPRLTVITTEYFEEFMAQNRLYDDVYADLPDYLLAHKFQQAELPVMMLGDLRSLIEQVHTPLAIRSSSLLEDALHEPFAGIYETKMIPNNQPSPDTRFQKLIEAIKFVYASTFFKQARAYLHATQHALDDEKMAVIIQEVVGKRHQERFYPNISGVARSYNFYPTGRATPESGIVSLALGLGKTIVDGGNAWFYSPAYPKVFPPHATPRDLLKQTQLQFWAVNMGPPPEYDPTRETEYLVQSHISSAERDGTLAWVASTYDPHSDTITLGLSGHGPRVLTFAPILALRRLPLTAVLTSLLAACKDALHNEVEIEFAMTFDPQQDAPARFGFLQVRPIVVSDDRIDLQEADLSGERVIAASDHALGNGVVNTITDIVYIKPDAFEANATPQMVSEIAAINASLNQTGRKYLLIGFGRWGSADPWLGIPVTWIQINGAKVIVEATLPQLNPDLSQGSHFFHNITSFQVLYFSIKHSGHYPIDWEWLRQQPTVNEGHFVKHVRCADPLTIKVDGRTGRGVIRR